MISGRTTGYQSIQATPLRNNLPLPDLLLEIGFEVSESDLQAAAAAVGGVGILIRLENPRSSAEVVGPAWIGFLNTLRSGSELAPSVVLLVELLVRAAFNTGPEHGKRLTASLRSVNFGWMGTWAEVNRRLAGQLYGHSRVNSAAGDYRSMRNSLTTALECWAVVEQLDSRDTDDQRRMWRGMRAVSRLLLARRSPDPVELLSGACVDFAISEEYGDRTPQHYELYSEAHERLLILTGDDAHLDAATGCLDRASADRLDTAGLTQNRASLMFARGLRALAIAGARSSGTSDPAADVAAEAAALAIDEARLDTLELDVAADLEFGADTELGTDTDVRATLDPLALAAARSAFIASAWLWTRSLTTNGPVPDVTVPTIKRGQAWLRVAHASRLLGVPYTDFVVAAVRDLRRCGEPNSPIVGTHWPWALLERARLLISEDDGLEEAAALTRAGLSAAETHLDPEAVLVTRLRVLQVEVDLRRATQAADPASCRSALRTALAVSSASGRVTSSALAYGARTLLPDGTQADPADVSLIRDVIDELDRRARRSVDQCTFNATHAASLLTRLDGSGPVTSVDETVQARIHALQRMALDADPGPGALVSHFNLARSALRLGRIRAAAQHREAALTLFTEAIEEFELVAATVESWDAAPAETTALDDGDAPVGDYVVNRTQCASLLGDTYLRRDGLRRDDTDVAGAIVWLERSSGFGNASAEHTSLLGSAYFKTGRRGKDPAALERAVQLKAHSRELIAADHGDVPREAYSVGAAAAFQLWRLRGRQADFTTAAETAAIGAATDNSWAWPLLQLADFTAASRSAAARLRAEAPRNPITDLPVPESIWAAVRRGDHTELRIQACHRIARNTEFLTLELGGRRNWETYVLDDQHGLLSSTLVMKPTPNRADAERESARTREFGQHLSAIAAPSWARAPQPLAVVDLPQSRRAVLVSYRELGRELSDLIAHRGSVDGPTDDEVLRAVERSLELLAIIHAWRGPGPVPAVSDLSIIRALRRELTRLGHHDPGGATDRWVELIPGDLPRVGKRDAHTQNWLVTEYGSVVALDLASGTHLPVGFEVAQLIEDMPLLACDDAGWEQRLELAHGYLSALTRYWPGIGPALPDVRSERWRTAYACFAARRAIFLLDRRVPVAQAGQSDRSRRQHAAAVLDWAIETVPDLSVLRYPKS